MGKPADDTPPDGIPPDDTPPGGRPPDDTPPDDTPPGTQVITDTGLLQLPTTLFTSF